MNRVLGFSFGTAPEPIKGRPHVVRVERLVQPSPLARGFLEEEHEFDPGGKKTRYVRYRPDGRQSHREEREYAEDGRLLRTTIYGESNVSHLRWEHSISADGRTRESIAFATDGTARERTIEVLNEAGLVVESASIDLLRNKRIELKIDYDPQGRPVRGVTDFEAYPELNTIYECLYLQDGKAVHTWRRQTGEVLVETGPEGIAPGAEPGTARRVDARDEKGNWIQMSIMRGVSSDDDEPQAILRRTIVYY